MLHTNFQGHRPFGYQLRYFEVFTIYGHYSHIGYVNKPSFPHPMEAPHEIWLQTVSVVSKEKNFENVESG